MLRDLLLLLPLHRDLRHLRYLPPLHLRDRLLRRRPTRSLFLHFEPGEHPQLPAGLHDDTHLSELGARRIAELAAREMARLHLPLVRYLKLDTIEPPAPAWSADLGDGTYVNPVLGQPPLVCVVASYPVSKLPF